MAVIAQVAAHERCPCPTRKRLDGKYPNEGYQLALFPYAIGLRMMVVDDRG